MTKINNLPISVRANLNALQPYVVARFCDDEWWYWGQWDDRSAAYNAAYEIGGEVFHKSEILA